MTLTNQMTTVQGPGYFIFRTFCYVLNYLMIESFDCCIAEYYLVESQYLQYFCSTFPGQKKFSYKYQIVYMFAINYISAYIFNIMSMRHPIVPVRVPPDPVRILCSGRDDTTKQVL